MIAHTLHALLQVAIIGLLFSMYRRARGNLWRAAALLVVAGLNAVVLAQALVRIWELL